MSDRYLHLIPPSGDPEPSAVQETPAQNIRNALQSLVLMAETHRDVWFSAQVQHAVELLFRAIYQLEVPRR